MEKDKGGYGTGGPAFVCWQKDVDIPSIDVTYSMDEWGEEISFSKRS